jgi:coatomer protein complex subunit alpha (xenin)
MQLLNRQVGAVNFAPLEERFQEIYQATRTFLPATPNMPSLVNYVRRTVDETDSRKILPIIPRDLESILTTDLTAGKQALLKNKLEEGVAAFKKLLQLLMVTVVSSQAQLSDASILNLKTIDIY